ncbi:MAG: PIN domain nuclease, partial [Armatimonadota bacterium]
MAWFRSLLAVCAQVLIEFWSGSTRPLEAHGLNRTPLEVYQDCLDILSMMSLLPDPEDIFERWLPIVYQYGVKGKQVHDARLVAVAQAYEIGQILTLNAQDFARYPEVSALLPQQIVA